MTVYNKLPLCVNTKMSTIQHKPPGSVYEPPALLPTLVPIAAEQRKVFRDEEGDIWVGFNVSYLPIKLDSRISRVGDAPRPRCYNEKFPYLCAVLLPDALTGDSLECFRRFDVRSVRGQYGLASRQIRSWGMFETLTFRLCQILLSHVNTTLDFSLPIFPFKLGYKRLYSSRETALKRADESRRAFCILFGMATYLIALTPNWMNIARDDGFPQKWLEMLKASPIGNFDVREGRVGAFIDFSDSIAELRRLPGLIRKHVPFWIFWGDGTSYRPPLKDRVDIRIASLFAPTKDEVMEAKTSMDFSSPNHSILSPFRFHANDDWLGNEDLGDEDAVAWAGRGDSARLVSAQISGKPSDIQLRRGWSVNYNLPSVAIYSFVDIQPGQIEEGSRQLPFETPAKFLERQHDEDEAELASMAETERTRLKRSRDGSRITNKSKVYHWEKHAWGYIRRRVARKEFEDYADYPSTQKRFSVVRNEWDICSDFDPDADPPAHVYSASEDDDDDDDLPRLQNPEKPVKLDVKYRNSRQGGLVPTVLKNSRNSTVCGHHSGQHERPTSTSSASEKFYGARSDSCTGSLVHSRSSCLGHAEQRMDDGHIISESDHFVMRDGCALPEEMILSEEHFQEALNRKYYIRPDVVVRMSDDISLDKMLYYRYGLLLRNVDSLVSEAKVDQSSGNAENAWAKTRGILYDVESAIGQFSVQDMLGISQFVERLLEGGPVPSVTLDIHPDNPFGKGVSDVANVLNIHKCCLDRDVYLLRPHEQGFVVALDDASLVVETLRRGFEFLHRGPLDVRDFVKLFAERGSPFRTLRLIQEPRIRLPSSPWDLGYRTLDVPPGAYAYAQYEKMLQAFMLQPRARSALGLGGPVWRAILEVFSPSDTDIISGPSDDVGVFGQCFTLPDGSELWWDALSESDLLFLCGTYKIRKGALSPAVFPLFPALISLQATMTCSIHGGHLQSNGRHLPQTSDTGVPGMSVGLCPDLLTFVEAKLAGFACPNGLKR